MITSFSLKWGWLITSLVFLSTLSDLLNFYSKLWFIFPPLSFGCSCLLCFVCHATQIFNPKCLIFCSLSSYSTLLGYSSYTLGSCFFCPKSFLWTVVRGCLILFEEHYCRLIRLSNFFMILTLRFSARCSRFTVSSSKIHTIQSLYSAKLLFHVTCSRSPIFFTNLVSLPTKNSVSFYCHFIFYDRSSVNSSAWSMPTLCLYSKVVDSSFRCPF